MYKDIRGTAQNALEKLEDTTKRYQRKREVTKICILKWQDVGDIQKQPKQNKPKKPTNKHQNPQQNSKENILHYCSLNKVLHYSNNRALTWKMRDYLLNMKKYTLISWHSSHQGRAMNGVPLTLLQLPLQAVRNPGHPGPSMSP